jgi:hypothetical protein
VSNDGCSISTTQTPPVKKEWIHPDRAVTAKYSMTPLGATLLTPSIPARLGEKNLKEILAAQRRYDAQHAEKAA